MGILDISEKVESALKNNNLTGARLGSGYSFVDGARDVQFEYAENSNKELIEDVAKKAIEEYPEYEISIKFRDKSYSFYVQPITTPESDFKGVPETE
jgi:hypothetical protein